MEKESGDNTDRGLGDSNRDELDHFFSPCREVYHQAIQDEINRITQEIVKQHRISFLAPLVELLQECASIQSPALPSVAPSREWVDIESLSQLRTVVGGRFQNLRKRWLNAGLPLREHRGDKEGEFELNEEGWGELSGWLLEQGYRSRTTGSSNPAVLFQIQGVE